MPMTRKPYNHSSIAVYRIYAIARCVNGARIYSGSEKRCVQERTMNTITERKNRFFTPCRPRMIDSRSFEIFSLAFLISLK